MERFLPIKGFEDRYLVSDFGNVYGRRAKRMLRTRLQYGYVTICLRKRGKKHTLLVHRLVLIAFLGDPPHPKMIASHTNGVRTDNRLENLVWETASDNERRKREHGTYLAGERCGSAKLTADQVREIRRLRGVVRQIDLAARFGVGRNAIQAIHDGQTWRSVV